jgi:RHS repeat-associated protein
VNYIYDSVGRLHQLTDGGGNPIVTYTYDANGRLSLKSNANGTSTTYQYDANGNVLHLVNYATGGTISSRFDYSYNALGLETSEVTLDGTWTYTYDADGQLIHAVFASTNSNVPSQDLAYSYDAMGNRITTVINGVHTTYATNDLNEYTSVGGVGYTYDKDGNLTFDGTNTYAYNSLNQLISVTGPSGTTTYTYNALGQRVASTTNGVTSQYVIDPSGLGNVVGKYTGANTLIADYSYGLGLTRQVTAGASYYYDFDALGSTVGLSNSSGVYVDKYSYLPFGGSLSASQGVANPLQFVGSAGIMPHTNGLQFMHARYLASAIGRFTSRDPLGLQAPNLYAYANNNPLTKIDPSGLVASPYDFDYGGFSVTVAGNYFGAGGIVFGESGARNTSAVGFNTPGPALVYYPEGPTSGPSIHLNLLLVAIPINSGPYQGNFGIGYSGFEIQESFSTEPLVPGGAGGSSGGAGAATSEDPDALIGPAGYGSANYVPDAKTLPYQVDFQNTSSATAPAQDVTVTDQLDPNLD